MSTVVPSCDSVNAAWPRKRISMVSVLLWVGGVRRQPAQLARELQSDRDADEHAEPGLLGEQEPHRALARLRILRLGGLPDLRLVGRGEPAALGEGDVQHALEAGSRVRDDLLGVREALRVAERVDGGVDLLGGVALAAGVGHARDLTRAAASQSGRARASTRPTRSPTRMPVVPATQLASSVATGMRSRSTAKTAAPRRSPSYSSPRRARSTSGIAHAVRSASAAPLPPRATGNPGSTTVSSAAPPMPPS